MLKPSVLLVATMDTKFREAGFIDRPYHVHNSAITVVRTTREEIEKLQELLS